MPRRSLLLGILAVAVLATGQRSAGQPYPWPPDSRPSHKSIGSPTTLRDAEERLAARLKKTKDFGEFQSLVKRLAEEYKDLPAEDKERLKKLAEERFAGDKLPDLAKDPALREVLKKFRDDPALKGQEKDLIKKFVPPEGTKSPSTGKDKSPDTPDPFRPPNPSMRPPRDTGKAASPDPAAPAEPDRTPDWFSRQLSKLFEGSGGKAKSPSDDSLRNLFKDARLGESRPRPDFDSTLGKFVPSGLSDSLAKIPDLMPKDGPDLSGLGNLFSGTSAPSGPSGVTGLPDGSGFAPSSAGEVGSVALMFLGLVGLGFVALMAWNLAPLLKTPGALWKRRRRGLGPWPVDPSQVATRQEVVQAFEYLALKCLGDAAETAHHRDVAARLGEQGKPAASADQLALVYERARYSPADEALSAADVAAARRELRELAGAA